MKTINLEKGQKIDLTKSNPGLNLVSFGLGWDIKDGHTVDVDAFAFCLQGGSTTNGGKLIMNGNDPALLFFNRKTLPGLTHSGDNLTGAGDGDDETIVAMLDQLPGNCTSVVFAANIFDGASNFGLVKNCGVNIYNGRNTNGETPIMKFDVSEDFSSYNGILVAELYRHDGQWKIETLGKGVTGTIDKILQPFE
jgi:tellurium resistance protein TerD